MVVIPNCEPDVFAAISHPARRRNLDLLIESARSVNALAEHFQLSRPAVSQHLRVLLKAGLVTEQRHGRPAPLSPRPCAAQARTGLAWRTMSSSEMNTYSDLRNIEQTGTNDD